MTSKKEMADELGITTDALHLNAARYIMERQAPGNVDGNTALSATTTYYTIIGRTPQAAVVESVTIRSAAVGVAGATIDILKVPSGTAMTAGTAVVTQIAGNAITADTDYAMAVVAAAKNLAAGDSLVAKIVSGAAETLKPLGIQAVLKL